MYSVGSLNKKSDTWIPGQRSKTYPSKRNWGAHAFRTRRLDNSLQSRLVLLNVF